MGETAIKTKRMEANVQVCSQGDLCAAQYALHLAAENEADHNRTHPLPRDPVTGRLQAAGALLAGREWREMPGGSTAAMAAIKGMGK